MTPREQFEAYYLSLWLDREDGIEALRNDTEGFVERDWRVWQAAIRSMTTDPDAAYAAPALSGPVPGGQLGLIETHPNYVAGFKAGHAAGKRRVVPPGYKLVPIRPTLGMLKAGGTAVLQTYCSRAGARPDRENLSTADVAYRTMVRAATTGDKA